MKVGVNVTMINPSGRPDDEIYQDELALIDLVEPLGFDSLMCVEHHFTGFAMIPEQPSCWHTWPAAPNESNWSPM